MAQVDFSNAHITPYGNNPTSVYNTGLAGITYFYDSSNNTISSNVSSTTLKSESAEMIYRISGSFSASGTEFYFGNGSTKCWRVTNVSFSSGDTYSFTVKASII